MRPVCEFAAIEYRTPHIFLRKKLPIQYGRKGEHVGNYEVAPITSSGATYHFYTY